jgi:hypothetical protein
MSGGLHGCVMLLWWLLLLLDAVIVGCMCSVCFGPRPHDGLDPIKINTENGKQLPVSKQQSSASILGSLSFLH